MTVHNIPQASEKVYESHWSAAHVLFFVFFIGCRRANLYKMLINAKIVECLFIEGTFGKHDEEILKIEKYIMLGDFIFHSIDFKTKQARLWDDTRITEFLSSHAATFIEQDSIVMLIL